MPVSFCLVLLILRSHCFLPCPRTDFVNALFRPKQRRVSHTDSKGSSMMPKPVAAVTVPVLGPPRAIPTRYMACAELIRITVPHCGA